MKLALPETLQTQILNHARATAPRECCGLVLGQRRGEDAHALALHPARNLAARMDRFEIAPEDHFVAQRDARRKGYEVIGCYHSHPGGAARPSAADLAGAAEDNFLWLIAAPKMAPENLDWTIAAFVYRNGVFTGADRVTSST
jgi:proteasome lid subunit RPN8/RPN11